MRLKVGDFGSDDVEVRLDGAPMRYVIEANEEEGWVECYVQPFPSDSTGAMTERRFGSVDLSWPDTAKHRREGNTVVAR